MQNKLFSPQPNVITYMDITKHKGHYSIALLMQCLQFFKHHPHGIIVHSKGGCGSTIEALDFGMAKTMTEKQFFNFRCKCLFEKINVHLPYKNKTGKMPKKWLSDEFYLDCLRLQDKLENRHVIHSHDFNFCRKYLKRLNHFVAYSND